jgi:HD-GYP domain-containing protein (c-di-GMP phosphodiesterase class II)
MTRRLVHYFITWILLTIYGIQVCPFLESLSIIGVAAPILIALSLQFFIRSLIDSRLISKSAYQKQSRLIFQYEFLLAVASGIGLTIFNRFYYGFPVESGLKLIVGFLLVGFFTALDLSLERELKINIYCAETGKRIEPDEHFFSQPKKLILFTSISLILTAGVVFLVINKDLDWLKTVGDTVSIETAQRSILLELLFVVGAILGHIFNLIVSYSRNFQHFLEKETVVLKAATNGDFSVTVPVSSNDEYGVMAKHTNLMVQGLKRRTEELQKTQDVTILSLASLAETRDNETGNHILRTQRYIKELALQVKDENGSNLDEETVDLLFKSAPLHDIGKVGIPDNILLKPGKLSDDEFAIMKTHANLGSESLEVAENELGSSSFLRYAREIAISHHERWDGTGYPCKLQGEQIPLSGRLMAVADVYDALISKRVYKPAFSHEEAKKIIVEGRGTHFDPRIVDVFLASETRFQEIAGEFEDRM